MLEETENEATISESEAGFRSTLAAVRRFMRPRAVAEQCELCGAPVPREHLHLVEPATRKLLCACQACTILFSNQDGRYKRVPRDTRFLENFELSDQQWESLLVPINMAFFFRSSLADKVTVLYPSPAGPVESLLPLESWAEIEAANPILRKMEADVEALLVNRGGRERKGHDAEYFLAPVDKCYELTGLIRGHWRGLSGGTEVWAEIERFFTDLKNRSVVISQKISA